MQVDGCKDRVVMTVVQAKKAYLSIRARLKLGSKPV